MAEDVVLSKVNGGQKLTNLSGIQTERQRLQGIVVMKFIRIFHRNKNLLYFNIAENQKKPHKKTEICKNTLLNLNFKNKLN